eukprot:4095713-Lingulodinium_polyedra.AAC.1
MDSYGTVITTHLFRTLLTDSGHYLLPTDDFSEHNSEYRNLEKVVRRYFKSLLKEAVPEDATPQKHDRVLHADGHSDCPCCRGPASTPRT